jgi:hypothetical protein
MHRLTVNHSYPARKERFVLAARSLSETKQVRYLLGLSSPAEREHIESEYFEDENAFQEMLTAEDELIDAYARGELEGEERCRFEKNFMSSRRGRDRVKFARAFAGPLSATQSQILSIPLRDIFKTFPAPGLLRTTRVAATIVFVAVLAWLVIDRTRMSNELRELRAESAELSKRTEAFQRSGDTKQIRTAEITTQLANLRAQSDKQRHRERGTTPIQRGRHLAEVKKDRERIVSNKPEQTGINTQDGSLGNALDTKITELPIQGRKFSDLLTLQTGTPLDDHAPGGGADQTNRTLEGVSVEPLSLMPRNKSSDGTTVRGIVTDPNGNVVGLLSLQPGVTRTGSVNGERADQANITLDAVDATNLIPNSRSWIRFQIELKSAAIHEDYLVTIKTADGHPITSVYWIEPLTPNQTIIDTPVISTGDLPSGDYVLLLMGKARSGSFVKVAEYSFKVIND